MSTAAVYRPDIDGLRAIAVLGVVAFHFDKTWMPGGFSGVDVFLVISGYLITSIIWRDIGDRQFSLTRFYSRRIQRIVPALAVMLSATLMLGYALLTPGDYADLGQSAAFAATGFGNLFFYWHTGYFDQVSHMQPLLHTWSLGVEEQFYFVWPILLIGASRLLLSRRLIVSLLVTIVLMGFALSIYEMTRNPKAAFYMPYARGWELAVGGLLAFSPRIEGYRLSLVLTAVGTVLILLGYVALSASGFPGYQALIPVVGAALIVWPKDATPLSRLLGKLRPVGLVSYSLYLWHWPILVYYSHYKGAQIDHNDLLFLGAITAVVSFVSWRYIEQPFRSPRSFRPVTLSAAAIAAVALVGTALSASQGASWRVPVHAIETASLDVMWQWDCPQFVKIGESTYCGFGANWSSAGERAMLWGDSHAEHLAPILHAAHPDIAFVLAGPCLPIAGGLVDVDIGEPQYIATCRAAHLAHLAAIRESSLDTVILSASWNSRISDLVSPSTSGKGTDLLHEGMIDLFQRPEFSNLRVFVVSDTPWIQPTSNPHCASAQLYLLRSECVETSISQASFIEATSETTQTLLRVAEEFDVTLIDPATHLCSTGNCLVTLNDAPLYRDHDHFRRNLSQPDLIELAFLLSLDRL